MILPDRITVTAQLASAQKAADNALAAWQQDRCELVSDSEVAEAKARVEGLNQLLSQLDDQVLREQAIRLLFHSFRVFVARILCVDSIEWFLAAILMATIPCGAVAIIVAVLRLKVLVMVPILGFVYFSASLLIARFLYPLDRPEYAGKLDELADWVKQRKAAIAQAQIDHTNAKRQLEKWTLLREVRKHYEEAVEEIRRVEDLLTNRHYQLAQYDWRSLRGVPFENFLEEVFRELGYSVQTTKTSGDKGVDLILTGKGCGIAVQAKGYTDSVGLEAVQQVYAGMTHYKCDRCIAVTNSTFTSAARDLAQSVDCLLIDGQLIPQLIEGRIVE